MTMIFGSSMEDARRHLGSWAQVSRIDSFIESDGPASGARRSRMISGGGLEIDVHPDRGLDIGQVTIDGIPIAWMEPQGIVAPSFYDANGYGWARTFGGGLLTTCGLDSYGLPCVDDGKSFGQHGKVNAIPAKIITTSTENESLVIEGVVRQSCVGGENITLRRRITTPLGGRHFSITDLVTNESSLPVVHMILYHTNLGWPLIEKGTTFKLPSTNVEPRDAISAAGMDRWNFIDSPSNLNQSEVFLHDLGGDDLVDVVVVNEQIGISLKMTFNKTQLPWLCQWKFFSEDVYVLGIEPMNTRTVTSRADAREKDSLRFLAPGESVTYSLTYSFENSAST
jgi:hypothetical protein